MNETSEATHQLNRHPVLSFLHDGPLAAASSPPRRDVDGLVPEDHLARAASHGIVPGADN